MIAGVGMDLVDVGSFGEQLSDRASGFVDGTFSSGEQRDARERPGDDLLALAARFAAKEAVVKAWSAARAGREPVLGSLDLREIEVVRDGYGRPGVRLHGAVGDAVARLPDELGIGAGTAVRIHLSLSHDGPMAAAVVVLEVE